MDTCSQNTPRWVAAVLGLVVLVEPSIGTLAYCVVNAAVGVLKGVATAVLAIFKAILGNTKWYSGPDGSSREDGEDGTGSLHF